MGPVFRAYDQDRDRLVAIKLFRLDLPPERVHQLVDEFEKLIAAGLQHPVIATPRATGIDGNSAYLAQDFAAADSLDIVMRESGAMPAAQALRVAGQLAEALDYAAKRQVVHGALHPRDILLSQEDIRIVGFGVARALEHVDVTAPVRRPYAAPERINEEGWDRSADVFSLAAIVYELLCGKRVTGTGSEAAEGLTEVPAGADLEAVQRVFALALASDPAYRFATATAFTDALKGALGAEAVSTESAPAKPKPKTRRPRAGLRAVSPPPVSEALPLIEATEEVQEVREVQKVREVQEVQEEVAEAVAPLEPAPVRPPRRRRAPAPTPVAIETVAPLALPVLSEAEGSEIESPPEPAAEAPVLSVVEELALSDVEGPIAGIPIEMAPVEKVAVEMPADFAPVTLAFEPEPEPAIPVFSVPPELPNPEPRIPHPGSTAVWPIGVAAIIGIALGFGAGYTVAIRDRAVAPVTVPATTTVAAQPVGKDFTEVAAAPTVAEKPVAPASTRPVSPKPAAEPSAKAEPVFAGRVLVRSTPSGARVIVDGQDRGQTPATIRELGRGEHRVRIVRDGYTAAERRVVLSPSQPSQSLSVPLAREPRPGSPKTSSKPSAKAAEPVSPASPKPTAEPSAKAGVGMLVVESRPEGAAVLVDGRQVGTTPMSLGDVRAGAHAVRIERDGYRIWTASVTIAAGEQNRVTASLEK